MKTLNLTSLSLLALTAVSGAVVASQPAAAIQAATYNEGATRPAPKTVALPPAPAALPIKPTVVVAPSRVIWSIQPCA